MFSFFAVNNGQTTVNSESFVFTCLTYRNVQRFRNGPVHEFYGLKASQMSRLRASSQEYPHVEKSIIFGNRMVVWWPTTVTARVLTSRQKEKPHGKNSSQYRRNFAVSLFLFAMRFSFCFESLSCFPWIFLFAASLFLFAMNFSFCRESFSFCREVILFAVSLFLFAVRFFFLPWG